MIMDHRQTMNARAEALVIQCRIEQGKIDGLRALQSCRVRAGLSQQKLSDLTGIARPTIRQWETGRHWPSAYQIPRLAAALHCSIEELYLGPMGSEEDAG